MARQLFVSPHSLSFPFVGKVYFSQPHNIQEVTMVFASIILEKFTLGKKRKSFAILILEAVVGSNIPNSLNCI